MDVEIVFKKDIESITIEDVMSIYYFDNRLNQSTQKDIDDIIFNSECKLSKSNLNNWTASSSIEFKAKNQSYSIKTSVIAYIQAITD